MLENINEQVMIIKNDKERINLFINDYKQFIIAYCNKSLKRYIDIKNDDEYSIAIMAFYESIKSYDISKGSFFSYAQRVIKFRLIDYYRKNKTLLNEKSIEEDKENKDKFFLNQSIENYEKQDILYLRKLEIESLIGELSQYNITFKDLIKASPKWKSTRKQYNEIINYILKNRDIIEEICLNNKIPIAKIQKNTNIPRKTIERSRKYIISVLIILLGDYQYIREYINLEV
ncbi:RNA polymerase sigma-I factor [Clostridium sp. Marseille-QA1073]